MARRWSRSFRSLPGRMLALALPVLTVSFALTVTLVERAEYRRQRSELRREVERTARVNGNVLAGSIWYVNVGSLTAGLETVLEHDDVVAAVARDADRTVLAWSVEAPGGGIRSGQGVGPPGIDEKGWPSVVEPVFLEHLGLRQEAGELEIYFTGRRVDATLARRLALDAVLFLLFFLCLAGSVVLVTRRAVAVPLARWRAALGGGTERLPTADWSSADEVGEVIRLYNERAAAANAGRDALEHRVRLFEDAVASLDRGFCIFDRDFRLASFNRRFVEILGHDDGVVEIGMSLSALLRANAAKGEYGSANVDAVIIDRLAIAASKEPYRRERERPDGTTIEVESTPLPGGGFVSVYTDVTPRKALEGQMRRMTLADPVTALANRALFHDRLRQALALTDRTETRLALFLIDPDHFRPINDAHGHEVGDGVLKEVADRLRRIARHSDTLARLEDDRFALIQQQVPSIDDAALLAHRIHGSLSRAFEIGDRVLRLTASIGITLYPDDDRVSRNLLRNAQLALAAAKAEGRHRYRFFKPEVDRAVARRRRLEEELFNALRDGQFVLHYQPRVELAGGALAGVEALLRWQHPERGLLLPEEFLPLAEDRGLIVPLTEWALAEAGRWRRGLAGEAGWRVAVALSPCCFKEANVAASVGAALEQSELEPRLLEVEVSAETIVRHGERATAGLHALRELGVFALLDGFGNGASPLWPRKLPVDGIRLGRQLVAGLASDPEAASVVSAAVCLGRRMRLRVTAEGVEDPEQLRLLREEGCAEAQGEAVSPPLTASDMARWLELAAGRPPGADA